MLIVPPNQLKLFILRKVLFKDDFGLFNMSSNVNSNYEVATPKASFTGRELFSPLVPLITGAVSVTTLINTLWIVGIVLVLGATAIAGVSLIVKFAKLFKQFEVIVLSLSGNLHNFHQFAGGVHPGLAKLHHQLTPFVNGFQPPPNYRQFPPPFNINPKFQQFPRNYHQPPVRNFHQQFQPFSRNYRPRPPYQQHLPATFSNYPRFPPVFNQDCLYQPSKCNLPPFLPEPPIPQISSCNSYPQLPKVTNIYLQLPKPSRINPELSPILTDDLYPEFSESPNYDYKSLMNSNNYPQLSPKYAHLSPEIYDNIYDENDQPNEILDDNRHFLPITNDNYYEK